MRSVIRWLLAPAALFCALAALPREARAQADTVASPPLNLLYIEWGGSGLVGSLNYERVVTEWVRARLGVTGFQWPIVFGATYTGVIGGATYAVPVRTSAAEKGGAIEFGLSALLLSRVDESESTFLGISSQDSFERAVFVTPQLAYSYRPQNGGVFIRLGLTPHVRLGGAQSENSLPPLMLSGVFSLGWAF